MFLMKIQKKYLITVAIVWAGCFMLFLFAYIALLAPQQKSKKRVESRLADIIQRHNSALTANQEDTKKSKNEEIEKLRETMRNFAYDFEDSANLTFDISQIANEKKVNSFSIRMQEDSRGAQKEDLKYIQENRIDISFTSDFNQFATFLNALERHRPVVFVDNFKITRSAVDDSNHRTNMKLAVFLRKPQDS
jgi:Tfp pilus assembly protein PilO